jgi:hypothetical protein
MRVVRYCTILTLGVAFLAGAAVPVRAETADDLFDAVSLHDFKLFINARTSSSFVRRI